MFRLFETLVDPYVPYRETDTPPTRLWPFLRDYSQPFRRIYAVTATVSILTAAFEVWLIGYMGRVVDLLGRTPRETIWSAHGAELAAVALLILIARPLLQGLGALLLNNTILPNFGTLIRWRAHRHVLRQSVGWFEGDFAGRIANRIMQTPPAAGEAVFQVFDAMTYSVAYLLGAGVLLAEGDIRLAIPLAVWAVLYFALCWWTTTRVGPASKAASDARSAVTGRVVDAYTNIHSVKMFAHHDRELDYAREAIERSRATFQAEMRIITVMDISLTTLNGLLLVGCVGYAIVLWQAGEASVGLVAAASALALRLVAMTGWIMWALTNFFQNLGVVAEGMETIAQPVTLVDRAEARPLVLTDGRIALRGADASLRASRRRAGAGRPGDRAGREGGPGRALGLGQVDAGEAAAAVLRRRCGADPDRRAGHRPCDAGKPAPGDRHGAAGFVAPAPLGARQHPLRPAGGLRGGGGRAPRPARRRTRSSSGSRMPRAAAAMTRRWASGG